MATLGTTTRSAIVQLEFEFQGVISLVWKKVRCSEHIKFSFNPFNNLPRTLWELSPLFICVSSRKINLLQPGKRRPPTKPNMCRGIGVSLGTPQCQILRSRMIILPLGTVGRTGGQISLLFSISSSIMYGFRDAPPFLIPRVPR